MDDYDRLPPELRRWLAGAVLPWSPRSALRIWRRAGTPARGLAALEARQAATLAREAALLSQGRRRRG